MKKGEVERRGKNEGRKGEKGGKGRRKERWKGGEVKRILSGVEGTLEWERKRS